jgi:hypothetical protein
LLTSPSCDPALDGDCGAAAVFDFLKKARLNTLSPAIQR